MSSFRKLLLLGHLTSISTVSQLILKQSVEEHLYSNSRENKEPKERVDSHSLSPEFDPSSFVQRLVGFLIYGSRVTKA